MSDEDDGDEEFEDDSPLSPPGRVDDAGDAHGVGTGVPGSMALSELELVSPSLDRGVKDPVIDSIQLSRARQKSAQLRQAPSHALFEQVH